MYSADGCQMKLLNHPGTGVADTFELLGNELGFSGRQVSAKSFLQPLNGTFSCKLRCWLESTQCHVDILLPGQQVCRLIS